jgi:hypothetical protein
MKILLIFLCDLQTQHNDEIIVVCVSEMKAKLDYKAPKQENKRVE